MSLWSDRAKGASLLALGYKLPFLFTESLGGPLAISSKIGLFCGREKIACSRCYTVGSLSLLLKKGSWRRIERDDGSLSISFKI